MLSVADILTAEADTGIEALLRPVMKVPESLPVPTLLRNMQAERRRVAIVVDEYGNTTGLVTLVDLTEETVGMLADEETAREPDLHQDEEGVYLVSGVVPISRVQRDVGIELPEQRNARTLSGWMAAHLGRPPQAGDEVRVTGGTVKVERVVSHGQRWVQAGKREKHDRADRIRVVVDDPDSSQDP